MRRAFLLAAAGIVMGGRAMAKAFTDAQREEIVSILREALRRDPSILREAIGAMQEAEERDRAGAQRSAIAASRFSRRRSSPRHRGEAARYRSSDQARRQALSRVSNAASGRSGAGARAIMPSPRPAACSNVSRVSAFSIRVSPPSAPMGRWRGAGLSSGPPTSSAGAAPSTPAESPGRSPSPLLRNGEEPEKTSLLPSDSSRHSRP